MNIQTQFYHAVNTSNLYDAENLVDQVDVTENSNIFLLTAVRRTDHQMLQLLIDHGADPTARHGEGLKAAAANCDAQCLKILIPYFVSHNWQDVVDEAFEKTVKSHQSFQNVAAAKVIAPYASQKSCNSMMAHAVFVHKNMVAPLLNDKIDPQAVLEILTSNPKTRLTNYHTPAIEKLEEQIALRQKQRIEEHLPSSPNTTARKL